MNEAEVKVFVGERCEEILLEVAEILGVKSPEEVLEAVQGSALRCLRCKEIGGHTDYCMVAANLKRGVPTFWAPWAVWAFPPEEAGHAIYIGCGGNIERLYVPDGDGVWLLDGERIEPGTTMESLGSGYDGQWLICLGPNGPILSPWELS